MKKFFGNSICLAAVFSIAASCAAGRREADIKLNPNPQVRYTVTVKIDNPPANFDRVEADVGYVVTNGRCVPMTAFEGVTLAPQKRLSVHLDKIGENQFNGSVFVDQMSDEDYFGMGVCHWSLEAFDVSFFTNKNGASASLSLGDILKEQPVTRYFSDRLFLQNDIKLVDIGEAKKSAFKDPEKTYSITLQAKKVH